VRAREARNRRSLEAEGVAAVTLLVVFNVEVVVNDRRGLICEGADIGLAQLGRYTLVGEEEW